jgi:[ribosomal protein S18]-alanine N-acetyltransferase
MRSLHKRSEVKIRFVLGKKIPPLFYKEAIINSDPWKTLFKKKKMAKDRIRVGEQLILAKVKSQTVGMALWTPNFLRGGYLRILSVHPNYRSIGVGQKLVTEFERQVFRQHPNSYLCVSSFNVGAKRFYRNLGYSKVGVITKLVHPKHDEILMRKTKQ